MQSGACHPRQHNKTLCNFVLPFSHNYDEKLHATHLPAEYLCDMLSLIYLNILPSLRFSS